MGFNFFAIEASHIEAIQPQAWQEKDRPHFLKIDWEVAKLRGFGITAVKDGMPVACGGIHGIIDGVGEGWLYLDRRVKQREMVVIALNAKTLIESELATAYHRIQIYVRKDFTAGVRLAGILGFAPEGELVDFPEPGQTSILFARTRQWD